MALTGRAQARIPFPTRIYIVALILRLIPAVFSRPFGIGLDDMFQYDMLARSIASGNGYRWYAADDLSLLDRYFDFDLSNAEYDSVRGVETSFRAPLYPAFLAVVYAIFGTGPARFFVTRIVQAILLGAPLAPLTYFLSLQIFRGNQRVARLSAWVVATYPMLLLYPLGLSTENLFFLLALSSILFLLHAIERPSTAQFLSSGFLLGLTVLTRSVILLFAGMAILWIWLVLKQGRGALLAALALMLTLLTWSIRNSLLHQRPTGIESSLGYNLYLGYHPQGDGSFVFGPSLDLLGIMDDAERDALGRQKASEFLRAQPERFLPLAINRLGYFFGLEKRALVYYYSNNMVGHLSNVVLIAMFALILVPFVVVSISACLGTSLMKWSPQSLLLLLLLIAYLLPHIAILSEDRFHLMLIPVFAVLAARFWAGGFTALASRWRESAAGKIALAVSACCIFLLLFNWGLELNRDSEKIVQLFGPNGNLSYFSY